MKEGAEQLGWAFQTDPAQRRPDELLRPGSRRPTSASATSPARSCDRRRPTCTTRSTHGADIARALHASSACWSRTGARRASRRMWTRSRDRPHGPRDRARAAGRGRVRRARVAGAAAALADRRPGGRRLPAPASLHRAVRHLRRGPAGLVGRRRRPALVDEFAARRGRLRLPDRERRSTRPALGRLRARRSPTPRAPQGADGDGSLRRRPSSACCATAATAASRSTRTAQAVPYYALTDELDVAQHAPGDRRTGAPARRGRRARDPAAGRRHAALAPRATTSSDSSRGAQRVPLRAGGCRLFSAHQMGTCRMGNDPQTSVADPWGELHDTQGRVDRRRQRVPDVLGHQPDDLDHGARAPHRRGDRRRPAAARPARQQPRSAEPQLRPKENRMAVATDDPGPRQALHRRRVGRSQRQRDDRRRQRRPPRRSWAASRRAPPEDVDRAVAAARGGVRDLVADRPSPSAPS